MTQEGREMILATHVPATPSDLWPTHSPGRCVSFLRRYPNNLVRVEGEYTTHFCLPAALSVGIKRNLDMQRSKVWGGYQNSVEDLGSTTASEERSIGEKEKREK